MAWTDADRDEFAKRLTVLAETLGEPMTPVRLAGYCAGLDDAPFEAIRFGLARAFKECKFFPKPVELRELGESSREWRRLREEEHDRLMGRHQKALGPPLSDAELRSNIARLQAVVKGLAAKRRMR